VKLVAGIEMRSEEPVGLLMFSNIKVADIKEQRHESLMVYKGVFTVAG
jgi:hypothetical protein